MRRNPEIEKCQNVANERFKFEYSAYHNSNFVLIKLCRSNNKNNTYFAINSRRY